MKTWAQVKDDPGLSAISIAIHSFDTITIKEWAKPVMEPEHWKRIISIAETSHNRFSEHPGQGFSWVDAVVIGDTGIALAPPEHLRDLIERAGADEA